METVRQLFGGDQRRDEKIEELCSHAGWRVDPKPIVDSRFQQLAKEMENMSLPHTWSCRPRTYFILSQIRRRNLMEMFIANGLDDTCIPYNRKTLPQAENQLFNYDEAEEFLGWQQVCQSKILELEKGGRCSIPNGDILFVIGKRLGEGSRGMTKVHVVSSKATGKVYARKCIARGTYPKAAQRDFQKELHALTRVGEHKHLIKVRGTYTDNKYFALLLQPVADMTLSAFLRSIEKSSSENDKQTLRGFFGCMASVVTVLHEEKMLHKDLKSDNFLIKDGRIILSDFGTSFDWSKTGHSMTMANYGDARTQRYASPEVWREYRFNRASDIWSLGVVFLEMSTVLRGKTLRQLDDHISPPGHQERHIYSSLPAALTWMHELSSSSGISMDNETLAWIREMLDPVPEKRPSAPDLLETIKGFAAGKFCGVCCLPEESDADTQSDLLDTDDEALAHQSIPPEVQGSEFKWSEPVINPSYASTDLQGPQHWEYTYPHTVPGAFPVAFSTISSHDRVSNSWTGNTILQSQMSSSTGHVVSQVGGIARDNARPEAESCAASSTRVEQPRPLSREQADLDQGERASSKPVILDKPQQSITEDDLEPKDSTTKLPKTGTDKEQHQYASQTRKIRTSRSKAQNSKQTKKPVESAETSKTVASQRVNHFLSTLPDSFTRTRDDLCSNLRETGHQKPARRRSDCELRSSAHEACETEEDILIELPQMLIHYASDSNMRQKFASTSEDMKATILDLKKSAIYAYSAAVTSLSDPAKVLRPKQAEFSKTFPHIVVQTEQNVQEATSQKPPASPNDGAGAGNKTSAVSAARLFVADTFGRILVSVTDGTGRIQNVVINHVPPSIDATHSDEGHKTTPQDLNEGGQAQPVAKEAPNTPTSERPIGPTIRATSNLSTFVDEVPQPLQRWESASTIMKRIFDDKASEAPTSVITRRTREMLGGGNAFTRWNDESYDYLSWFASQGKVAALRHLLNSGCNPGTQNKRRWRPLCVAIKGCTAKHNKCVFELLNNGADVRALDRATGRTYLHYAIAQPLWDGYSTTVYMLMMAGADPNIPDKTGNLPFTSLLIGNGPLAKEQRDALLILLAPNFDTRIDNLDPQLGENPLHLAIRRKDPHTLEAILAKIPDENTTNAMLHYPNMSGLTPLLLVMTSFNFGVKEGWAGGLRLLELLLEKGANPNDKYPSSGNSSLHLVILFYKNTEVFDLLYKYKADPSLQNNQKFTPRRILAQKAHDNPKDTWYAGIQAKVKHRESWGVPCLKRCCCPCNPCQGPKPSAREGHCTENCLSTL